MTPYSSCLPFQQALLEQIEESLISLSFKERLRNAFYLTPRHCFIHRYRLPQSNVWRQQDGSEPQEEYRYIYQDTPLVLVGGHELWNVQSTNSQPSFVMQLAHYLDVRSGDNVLEVGSGSGWLAGILGQLAETAGQVTGLEVIPELARQSAQDIASLGISNVNIICCDGSGGYLSNAPYDRIVFTAAIFDLPSTFYDQIKPNGILIVPIRTAVGRGETIYVLQRTKLGFESVAAIDGFFVDMKGVRNALAAERCESYDALKEGTFTEESRLWWWGSSKDHEFTYMTAAFRTFITLSRADAVRAFEIGPNRLFAFGLGSEKSLCIATPGSLKTFGASEARDAFIQSVHDWSDFGMPSGAAWSLTIQRAGQEKPHATGLQHARGDSVFSWSLKAKPIFEAADQNQRPQPH